MALMAQWGDMKFEISSNSLSPLKDFKTGFKIKNENNNDTSGTPPTNTTGRDTEQITFTVTYSIVDGSDVRRRFGAWRALIGKVNIFYLGGQPFGAQDFQLQSADLSSCEIDNNGTMLYAEVAVTLVEYVKQTKKNDSSSKKSSTTTNKNKKSTTGSSRSRAVSETTGVTNTPKVEATEQNKRAAMDAKPSREEKERIWG